MPAKKNHVQINTEDFFDDATALQAEQNVYPEHDGQYKRPKRKKRPDVGEDMRYGTMEQLTGRKTKHVHALIFEDDWNALKIYAGLHTDKYSSTSDLIREILSEFARNHVSES